MPRKFHGKTGADRAARSRDGSAVKLHDLFRDRETQARASGPDLAGIVNTLEFFKDEIQLLGRDLIALVGKRDDDVLFLPESLDVNVRAGITVGDGIS